MSTKNRTGSVVGWQLVAFCVVGMATASPAVGQLPAPWRTEAGRTATQPQSAPISTRQVAPATTAPSADYYARPAQPAERPEYVTPENRAVVRPEQPQERGIPQNLDRIPTTDLPTTHQPAAQPVTATAPLVEEVAEPTNSLTSALLNREDELRAKLVAKIRLEDWFPESLRTKRFLIADYQWISLFAVILLGMLADIAVRFAMHHLSMAWFRLMRTHSVMHVEPKIWRPVGLLAQAIVWYAGTLLVNLPEQINDVLALGLKFLGVWIMVWTIFQWIDILAIYFSKRASMTASRFDDLLVPLMTKSLKVLTICLGLISSAEVFHLPITALIGGLGLSGAALAFASKDAISNLFGSVTVLVDRPFEIGDWIITDGVEGTVEQVGFRSTRVRTFHNSQISVPNSTFTTAVVDNMGRRHYQRVKTNLAVAYGTTTEQIEALCEGIRELIRNHPYTRKEHYHVFFHELGPTSLDIMLNFFLCCPDRPTELQARHELLMDFIKLARALDITFAAPNQKPILKLEDGSESGKVLEFKQPAAVGKHEAAKVIDQRATRSIGPAIASPRRLTESA